MKAKQERRRKGMHFNMNSIGVKIMASFILGLVLMLVIGAVSIVRLGQFGATVTNLSDHLARQRQLSNDILTQTILGRLYATKYISSGSQDDLARYKKSMVANLDVLMLTLGNEDLNPQQKELYDKLQSGIAAYQSGFQQIANLKADREKLVTDVLDVQASQAEKQLLDLSTDAYVRGRYRIAHYADVARLSVLNMRMDAYRYLSLSSGDEGMLKAFSDGNTEAVQALRELEKRLDDSKEAVLFDYAKVALNKFSASFPKVTKSF